MIIRAVPASLASRSGNQKAFQIARSSQLKGSEKKCAVEEARKRDASGKLDNFCNYDMLFAQQAVVPRD